MLLHTLFFMVLLKKCVMRKFILYFCLDYLTSENVDVQDNIGKIKPEEKDIMSSITEINLKVNPEGNLPVFNFNPV